MSDLFRAGAQKPLAYLPLRTIRDVCGYDPSFMQDVLENDWGLKTAVFESEKTWVESGALFVWHEASLRHFLNNRKDLLEKERWPKDPHEFVCHVAYKPVAPKTPLFDLIADAFGDKENRGRTDRGGCAFSP